MKTSSAAVDATRESHLNAVQLPHHFELIDTGRGFCALTILVFHFRHFLMPEAGAPLPETDLGALPFHAILRPLYQYGLYAVHAFWLISGFVFSHVYGDGKVRQGHIYALNRFSRLYPLHFVTLVTVAILQAISYYQLGYFQIYANNDTCRFILHIFFASNWWLQEVDSFNAPIWSVSVEVLVYVIFFFSARHAIGRTGMATAALATTGFALFWVTKLIVFYCMGCFYVGAVIYVLNRRAVMISPGVNLATSLVLAILLSAVPLLVGELSSAKMSLLRISIFTCWLWVAAATALRFGATCVKRLRWIGDITYSSYLVHVPVQILILVVLDSAVGDRTIVSLPWFFLAYILGVMLLSRATFLWFERPAQNMIRQGASSYLQQRRHAQTFSVMSSSAEQKMSSS